MNRDYDRTDADQSRTTRSYDCNYPDLYRTNRNYDRTDAGLDRMTHVLARLLIFPLLIRLYMNPFFVKKSCDIPSLCSLCWSICPTYFASISHSILTISPSLFAPKTVSATVCGIRETVKLFSWWANTVKLMPSTAIEPFIIMNLARSPGIAIV